jgi:hypothetical protein
LTSRRRFSASSAGSGGASECNLSWKTGPDLNRPAYPSGLSYSFVKKGPYIEGTLHRIKLIAKYEKMTQNGLVSCSKMKYRSFLTEFQVSQGVSLEEDTGILSVNIFDIDAYLDGLSSEPQKNYNSLDYFDIARRPNPRRIFIDVETYPIKSPENTSRRTFFLDIATNWNSRRRAFLIGPRKIDTKFAIDRKLATNEQYYAFLQSRKYI